MAFKTLLLMFNDNGKLNRATVARVAADPGPDGVERVLFAIVNAGRAEGKRSPPAAHPTPTNSDLR